MSSSYYSVFWLFCVQTSKIYLSFKDFLKKIVILCLDEIETFHSNCLLPELERCGLNSQEVTRTFLYLLHNFSCPKVPNISIFFDTLLAQVSTPNISKFIGNFSSSKVPNISIFLIFWQPKCRVFFVIFGSLSVAEMLFLYLVAQTCL